MLLLLPVMVSWRSFQKVNKGEIFMILTDIRKYLSERNVVSLQDLSLHFKIDPDAMQGMLEHWVDFISGVNKKRLLNPGMDGFYIWK